MTPVEEIREAARLMRLGTPPAWQVAVADLFDLVADLGYSLTSGRLGPAVLRAARAYLGGAS